MQAQYIALEGPDGAGKTTQMALLERAFAQAGIPAQKVREPGGTPAGDKIREILLTGADDKITPIAEALLFSANRNLLVEQVIRPSLGQGRWVLSDRTFLTTWAFQGYGRGLPLPMLHQLTDIAIGTTRPDLMIVLDVLPSTGLNRKAPQALEGLTETRFESVGEDFHTRNRQGFLQYVTDYPDRATLINGTHPVAQVHAEIIQAINTKFNLTLQPQA